MRAPSDPKLPLRIVGRFDKLEEQMCQFTADFDRRAMGYSSDRMDALVWALTKTTRRRAHAADATR
jgi:phage terminase large subunit-like protein